MFESDSQRKPREDKRTQSASGIFALSEAERAKNQEEEAYQRIDQQIPAELLEAEDQAA